MTSAPTDYTELVERLKSPWDKCDSRCCRKERAEAAAAIEALAGEVARLNKWADGFTDAHLKERATGEAYQRELREEIERLRANDARYKFLRRQNWNDSEIACVMQPKAAVKLGHDCPSLERLDAAIDAAIAKETK